MIVPAGESNIGVAGELVETGDATTTRAATRRPLAARRESRFGANADGADATLQELLRAAHRGDRPAGLFTGP